MVWATGKQLQGGKYVIQGVLGQGGFGITYKARHVSLNHYVVIKTPNEYLQYEPDYHKYVARFIEEAQILARLSRDPHPSIVGVHDLFQEGIISCLVMNFVDGENLFELVRRRGAIPEAEAVRYIRQIGEVLTLVHQVGLTHRDAHPGNILLRQNGKAVLIDFGIAKELVPSTYTSTGAVGNEGFAPYEQLLRGSREPNVDVYCLAATLYYTLTGQRPTKSLDRKLYQEPLIEPRRIVPGISKQVNRAILKGMALKPKKRPQSMQAWLKLLEEPRAVTPPPAARVHRQEVVRPSDHQTSRQPSKTADARKTRTNPWALLTLSAGFYLVIGFLFGQELEVLGVVVACAMSATCAMPVAWPRSVAWAVPVFWAAGALVEAASWIMFWIMAVPTVLVEAGVREGLQESFSKFHTFLILLGTSWLGLGLGWLLASIF
ncbi:serine/threonine protein kinase [Coleofasciculus sp. E2-BRE-01]|uniref:serine/threonine protein kinase n=1 Tax=Coleofasciculus sp. E2-BRE-01 TaxID=3069524 RepID=UPI0032F6B3D1